MDPSTNSIKSIKSVLAIIGSVLSFAQGCPIGTRVNVSFTVGIKDRKKLKDRQKFSKKRVLLFPFFRLWRKNASTTKSTIKMEKACPMFRPPCLDTPNDVKEAIIVP